jgi:4-hydroxybenzoate polyprenyltransferase
MLFASPFAALAGFWVWGAGPGRLSPPQWAAAAALLLAAMVSAFVAGMAFNRLADARFDALNPRTCDRALPAGRLSRRWMAALTVACAVVFLLCAVGFYPLLGNPWPALLALPMLAVLLGYSYSKRFTVLCHWWIGLAQGLAPVGVWIALTGRLDWPPVLLGAAVVFWTAGFDILYSLQDVDFDRASGLKSLAARSGVRRALVAARLNHVAMIALLALPYALSASGAAARPWPPLGGWYLAGLAALAGLLVYEHTLVRADDLRRLNQAFFTVNAAGAVLFALLGVIDVLA